MVAVPYKDRMAIVHKVWEGETVFSIASLYHSPPAMVADANGIGYKEEELQEKQTVLVPVGVYNQLTNAPADPQLARALYYQLQNGDDLYRVSWRANVSPQKLKTWNKLGNEKLQTGKYILVGWVAYDTTYIAKASIPKAESPIELAETNATAPRREAGQAEELYQKQIQDGNNLINQKGTAVFFKMPVKTAVNEFYAFHNEAPRGTVIRVVNPGTGMEVYVKVLGSLPDTRQYHNAIIGITDGAKAELGVREDKMWAELSYTGY